MCIIQSRRKLPALLSVTFLSSESTVLMPKWIAHFLPQLLGPMVEGLSYMHEVGWLHCDVKPDNFLVDNDLDIKLIDFSISRARPKGLGKLFGGMFNKVQGTRSYMSPEQIRGKLLNIQSDIYGLGCTLYELLATKPPFTGSTPGELLKKHLRSRIPVLHTINKNVTEEFSQLLQEMMAKKSADRPDSMESVRARIKQIRVYNSLPKAPEKLEDDEEDNL